MDWVAIALYGGGILLALFLARGVYLIGKGREVEHQARSKSINSSVLATGWMLLDSLRNFDHPLIVKAEQLLGFEQTKPAAYVHKRCGSSNVTKRGAGWYCHDCEQQTTAVKEVDVDEVG